MQEQDFSPVNQAFTKQSVYYDAYDEQNPTLLWMRKVVRNHVLRYLSKSDYLLELNAGTGLDACFFINQKAIRVHATDLTDGMVAAIQNKITDFQLQSSLAVQQCSYTELDQVHAGPFNYIFSNFGGLNCVDDLKKVTRHFPALLVPGAYVTLVIMQPICPWELLFVLKGRFKYALRRLNKKGTMAHLEGNYFMTYYFTPDNVMNALGKDFKKIDLQGLATFTPPPQVEKFPHKYPRLFHLFTQWDEKLSGYWPFHTWGDHFIITAQYLPDKNT